jgi:hypothetical protein
MPEFAMPALEVSQSPPGYLLMDPYIHGIRSVELSGIFDCLRRITVNDLGQVASFELTNELRNHSQVSLLAPAILLDALWRLSVMRPTEGRMPLYVPMESRSVVVEMGLGEDDVVERLSGARLIATRPVPVEGREGVVLIRHAVAIDTQGKTLAINTDILAKESSEQR